MAAVMRREGRREGCWEVGWGGAGVHRPVWAGGAGEGGE